MAKFVLTFEDMPGGKMKTTGEFFPEMKRGKDGKFHPTPAQSAGYEMLQAMSGDSLDSDDET